MDAAVRARRITSEQLITVDGDAGTVDLVSLDDHEPEAADTVRDRSRTVRTAAITGTALAVAGAAFAIVRRRKHH